MITIEIDKAQNGYTVVFDPVVAADTWVAKSREEVGRIIKDICDDVFSETREDEESE